MGRFGQSKALFDRFLLWRERHIKEPVFVVMLSFLVGLLCAVAAALLKTLIHFIQSTVTSTITYGDIDLGYLFLPVVGVLLSGLFVKYVVRDDISHGVTRILYSLSQHKSRIKPHNMWSSIAASSMTIGFGGSVGAESPIVLTGSAIGSNVGRFFKMEQKYLMLLVGCGAAGAIAGIFKAPITGLIFVIEVLMLDLTLTSVMPLLVSSVTGATMAYAFFGTKAMFTYTVTHAFDIERIPMVMLLGLVCGLGAFYFIKLSIGLETWVKKLPRYIQRYLLSAVALSLLIFLIPPLYGEGYDTIARLIEGDYREVLGGSLFEYYGAGSWALPVFLLLIILTKVVATVVTNTGGGCGGVFAPSLFMGSVIGFLFAYLSNKLSLTPFLPTDNFALMGMAGVMAGVMHAPLTGTFLIAELTGSYNLFLPLLVVSITSYGTIRLFLSHSIYSLRLAQAGKLLTHQKDKAVLTLLQMEHVIETDFSQVHPQMTLGDVVKVFGESRRNTFPVVDDEGVMRGLVLLDNIRNIMFRPELYNRFRVKQFMVSPPAKIRSAMNMDEVMTIFDDTKAWTLPVVDEEDKYMGFVSKSQIFNSYRKILIDTFNGD